MSQQAELSYTSCSLQYAGIQRELKISQVNGRPLIGFAAWSNSGKTSLIEQLIALLSSKDLPCAVIKHHAHLDPIDQAGKDSFRFAQAGALSVTVSAPTSWAQFSYPQKETSLAQLAGLVDERAQLILIEGFKHHKISKFEFSRMAHNPRPIISSEDELREFVLGCISDNPQRRAELATYHIPSFELDDIQGIAHYLSELIVQFHLQYG